jgi:hypothetical protein
MHRAFVALAEQWTNDVTPPVAQRQKPAVTEEDSQQPDSSSLATWMFGKSLSAGRQQAFLGDKNWYAPLYRLLYCMHDATHPSTSDVL